MGRLRILTAGESHGPQLTAIVDGCPAGLDLQAGDIDRDLGRRQLGYGRGERQSIESDRVLILSGVRYGKTTGAPITLAIENRDAANWGEVLAVEPPTVRAAPVTVPRPGHADLAGALLYGVTDMRDVIERASARETAARVACGAVAKRILAAVGCAVASHVTAIGDVTTDGLATQDSLERVDDDPVRCVDTRASAAMRAAIDAAQEAGDTLGGVFEVLVDGCPPGLGSYVQSDRRLSAALGAALLSIPAVKAVEIGAGFAAAAQRGSSVHDEIAYTAGRGYRRVGNRAGGVEGGISTGEQIVVRAAMKPIATLRSPLGSVDTNTHEAVESRFERSDTCAVPAAAVVGEAVVAAALADALLDRCGGATVSDLVAAAERLRDRFQRS